MANIVSILNLVVGEYYHIDVWCESIRVEQEYVDYMHKTGTKDREEYL